MINVPVKPQDRVVVTSLCGYKDWRGTVVHAEGAWVTVDFGEGYQVLFLKEELKVLSPSLL